MKEMYVCMYYAGSSKFGEMGREGRRKGRREGRREGRKLSYT